MKYEISAEVKEIINELEKNDNGCIALSKIPCNSLDNFDIQNKYEVANAISLFLNFDIKGACFGGIYWFATKCDGRVKIASYNTSGEIISFNTFSNEEWYTEVKPFFEVYINDALKVYSSASSEWYYDHANVWHNTKGLSGSEPYMVLHF